MIFGTMALPSSTITITWSRGDHVSLVIWLEVICNMAFFAVTMEIAGHVARWVAFGG
jgi:hypothetical protein